MIPVEEALARITGALTPLPAESVALTAARGRVLAEDVVSRRTQPPVAVSAMDGYAVRAADVANVPAELIQIGESAAGRGFDGAVAAGQTVRIFTGAPVPDGADCVIMQEDTKAEGERIVVDLAGAPGKHIRPAGLDFQEGEAGLKRGHLLSARDIGLAAAMNVPWLKVTRRPRVALLATGDELVRPGEPIGESQIVSSNSLSLAALVESLGGAAIDLGIAQDNADSLKAMAAGAQGADLLVTLGGASVGDHDLVQSVLGQEGLAVDFWRIAMRPGKPLIFGKLGDTPMLGLPGNPVSALVCGLVYLRPALLTLLGATDTDLPQSQAVLASELPANDHRQDYLRARLGQEDGRLVATPFGKQDSSMLSRLAAADCLIVRPPHDPPIAAGDTVAIVPLDHLATGL